MKLRLPIDVSPQLSGGLKATPAVTSIPGSEPDIIYLDDVIREAVNDPPLAGLFLNIEKKRGKSAAKFRH